MLEIPKWPILVWLGLVWALQLSLWGLRPCKMSNDKHKAISLMRNFAIFSRSLSTYLSVFHCISVFFLLIFDLIFFLFFVYLSFARMDTAFCEWICSLRFCTDEIFMRWSMRRSDLWFRCVIGCNWTYFCFCFVRSCWLSLIHDNVRWKFSN